MSIENNLTRIADALEALVHKLDHIGSPVAKKQTPVDVQPTQVSTPAPAVTPPPPVSPPPAQTSVAVTPPPAPVTPPPVQQPAMTDVELNAALVAEYNRLGSRDPIDAAMKSMNVTSINNLKPEQYGELLSKVRAL